MSIFYIVATPIGNLEDMTFRAIKTLSNVDEILCEDTRVTRKLLQHYNINTPTRSYHAQSSDAKEAVILDNISQGKTIALVSDAGTPTISDPGVKLVASIRRELPDTKIVSIPGASALITALSTTGFNGNQFTFYGFLPHKKGRGKIFSAIANEKDRVSIFYESPHRLVKTLESLVDVLGDTRQVCVARELTKMFEETMIFSAKDMLDYYQSNPDKIKGECVILVNK